MVKGLKKWRRENKLSQAQAAQVMRERGGVPVPLVVLKSWEGGRRSPGALRAELVAKFLVENSVVNDPPQYAKQLKIVSVRDAAKIRRLRKGGLKLLAIAEQYSLSESAVSRICSTKAEQQRRARRKAAWRGG